MTPRNLNHTYSAEARHAYLILAHHEFDVLAYLIHALDDIRNDIYIHFDQKISRLPELSTQYAGLIILEKRVDVRWGDVSVVEAEFILFEQARQAHHYSYYHLLSGVDMPLHNQNYLHHFFNKNAGKEFIGFSQGNLEKHIERKVKRYHLFPSRFRNNKGITDLTVKTIRFLYMRLQLVFGIKRNDKIRFKKGTQWVSLTDDFVGYILSKKQETLYIYRNTFCADEIAIQTLCWNSPFRRAIYNTEDEAKGSLRMIQWINNEIYDWELKDLPKLLSTNALFARKFNSRSPQLLKLLSEHLSNTK